MNTTLAKSTSPPQASSSSPTQASRTSASQTSRMSASQTSRVSATEAGRTPARHRLHPYRLVIDPPRVSLLALPAKPGDGEAPVLIDIERIKAVTPLDTTFQPRPFEAEKMLDIARPAVR